MCNLKTYRFINSVSVVQTATKVDFHVKISVLFKYELFAIIITIIIIIIII